VPHDDIVWIEAEDYCARIHLRDRTVLVRESLRSLVDGLSGAGFVRVHRSTIARAFAIRAMEPLSSGDQRLTLTNGTLFRVSRTYRTALVKALARRRQVRASRPGPLSRPALRLVSGLATC
jgi:DNA-binding LytR/AlgR family response regulator